MLIEYMLIESTAEGAGMDDETSRWITTSEAAQRLGVKRATLYAYVSRGLLHSERRPGQQESLFDRTEIDGLASTTRASGAAQPLLRFRSVATSVSSQLDGDLLYRGVPLADVVDGLSFDDAAALVLGSTSIPIGSRRDPGTQLSGILPSLPLERRLPVALQLLAAADPLAVDTDPDRTRQAVVATIRQTLAAFDPAAAGIGRPADLPSLLVAALRRAPATRTDGELMRVLLTTLLDHGLTASTIGARVAASTRAGIHDCLCAGFAVMSGPLHGAAPIAARALLDDPRRAPEAAAAALRAHSGVPGFGHFLYPEGDPRAELVLTALWRRRGTARLRRRVEELSEAVAAHSGLRPNIDLASAAVMRALNLPATAGEVVFQVARSYGITAHVLEEYTETPLRWRGREATG